MQNGGQQRYKEEKQIERDVEKLAALQPAMA